MTKMKVGKKYKFGYLQNIDAPTVDTETCYSVPKLYDYSENVKTYVGELIDVRDISMIYFSCSNRHCRMYRIVCKFNDIRSFVQVAGKILKRTILN